MSTASPLLPLFKEQLEAECAELAKSCCLDDRGHSLIYWYFLRLHNLTVPEIEEIFCDGGGDLGIDPGGSHGQHLVDIARGKAFIALAV